MIEYRELDRKSRKEINEVCGILWEFWLMVNRSDLSAMITVPVGPLDEINLPAIEAELYSYFYQGCFVRCAWEENRCVGILIGNLLFQNILAIRALYTDNLYRDKGVGKGLIDSLSSGLKYILFQTHKNNPPQELFVKVNSRAKKLYENEHLITWLMGWGHGVF